MSIRRRTDPQNQSGTRYPTCLPIPHNSTGTWISNLWEVNAMTVRTSTWVLATGIALVTVVAFGASLLPRLSAAPAPARTIYMAAVEPKGGTTSDKESFPTIALPPGGGYVLKAPDNTGRWEVSTYQWQPSLIMANQGEQVTLEIVGINGAEHVSSIPGYVSSFTVKRGQVTRVSFMANRAGMFPILCFTHNPTMTGNLVILPRQ